MATEINDYNGAFMPDDDGPTHILICDECGGEINYYNDEAPADTTVITIGAFEFVFCGECGHQYNEGDKLQVVFEYDAAEADYYNPDDYYTEFYSDMDVA